MLTATFAPACRPREFALRALAGSLGLFALLRLNWIEAHALLPATQAQAAIAVALFGTPTVPVAVTLACSGADALALCGGAILAYPVPRPARVAGAAGGVLLILGLNTLRIGTLGGAAASAPAWFDVLHLYAWPTLLTLAIAAYVLTWMRFADKRHGPGPHQEFDRTAGPSAWRPRPSAKFIVLTGGLVVLFSAVAPWYLGSAAVLALAGIVARAAASCLAVLGTTAHADANVLWTARGGFMVTQECLSTPLIPVYLAAVCAYAGTRRRMVLGILAALPLFTVLGFARLLLVALPGVVGTPLFFVHAFYQLLLGGALVVIGALWRHGRRKAPGYAIVGIVAGVILASLSGPLYTHAVDTGTGITLTDPQGREALAFLPGFQIGLYVALWVAAFVSHGPKRLLAGLALLGLTQVAGLLAVQALVSDAGIVPQVRDIRAWAVAGPVLILAVMNVAHPRR